MFHGWELLTLTLGSLIAGWVTHAFSYAMKAVKRVAFQERIYSEQTCLKGVVAIMKRLSALHLFSERREMIGARMEPSGIIVGLTFVAFVDRMPEGQNRYSMTNRSLRVIRWRWLPPLVPDNEIADDGVVKCPAGIIRVLRKNSTAWYMQREHACPAAVPSSSAASARALAARIVSLHNDTINGAAAQVRVVLSGAPGCGKTTTARLVAESLGSVLVSGFDPSRPGQHVHDVFAAVSGYHLVFSLDELDVCLRRAVHGALSGSCVDVAPPAVTDKATWNALMDMLQFMPNVMLIMSTNLTFAELDALDDSGAMLRAGRVTQRIAVEDVVTNNNHNNKNRNRNKTKRKGHRFET